MKFIKINQRPAVSFNVKEILVLLMAEKINPIYNLALTKPIQDAKSEVVQLVEKSSDDRDEHELWFALFGLTQEFGKSCEIGFYLKDSFDSTVTPINTLKDLVDAKTDPPDIIVIVGGKTFEFELKRYKGLINDKDMLEFLTKKILRYSDPGNFFIITQPTPYSTVDLNEFEKLSADFTTIVGKRDVGRVCFSLNANNQDHLNIFVYPQFRIEKLPFISGSDQVKELMKDNLQP
jgi:hypothetical protein